jgi:hypothetical protein
MKRIALALTLLCGHFASLPSVADLTVLGVFVDEKQFALVMTEGGEVPFYWTHLTHSRLLPVYSNGLVLKGTKSIGSRHLFTETRTPVLLSYAASEARLETGMLAARAKTRFVTGVQSVVGGTLELQGRSKSRLFHFDPKATESLQKRVGKDLAIAPFVSPREIVVLMDAGEWTPGHHIIVDREVLPLQEYLYRAHLSDGATVQEVGSVRTLQDMGTSALTIPISNGAQLAFSSYDLGPHLPALWHADLAREASKLEYLPIDRAKTSSLGYDLGLLEFPKADASCVGWLLADH